MKEFDVPKARIRPEKHPAAEEWFIWSLGLTVYKEDTDEAASLYFSEKLLSINRFMILKFSANKEHILTSVFVDNLL